MADLLNKKAPDFKLVDQNEEIRSLADFKGEFILLYFYPKDMTTGCTLEAQGFRNRSNLLNKLGIQVLGVSADSVESHKKFADANKINFPLLADVNKKVIEKYGVWVEKSIYGKTYMGIQRDSFLIDREGKLIKHYVKVSPADHPTEVIKDVKEILAEE
jgi:peroxiredoxin Q/BCP